MFTKEYFEDELFWIKRFADDHPTGSVPKQVFYSIYFILEEAMATIADLTAAAAAHDTAINAAVAELANVQAERAAADALVQKITQQTEALNKAVASVASAAPAA